MIHLNKTIFLVLAAILFACTSVSEKKETSKSTTDSLKTIEPKEMIYYPDTVIYTDQDSILVKQILKQALVTAADNIEEKDLYLQSDSFSILAGSLFDRAKTHFIIHVKNVNYNKYTYIYELDKEKFNLKLSTKNDVAEVAKDSIADLNKDNYNDYIIYRSVNQNSIIKKIYYIWLYDFEKRSFNLQNKNTITRQNDRS